jgi:hypothetical protein
VLMSDVVTSRTTSRTNVQRFQVFLRRFSHSIIGATENRRDRLSGDFSVLSDTSLILFKADVVPFLARFDLFAPVVRHCRTF